MCWQRYLIMMAIACLGGCAPKAQTISLRLSGDIPDALVTIDEVDVGSLQEVQARGVALPPGRHFISVEKPGYFPWDRAVSVKEGDELVRLRVELTRTPD